MKLWLPRILALGMLAFAVVATAQVQEQPAILFSGMGTLHHPIATKSHEAQAFFDQGLTLVYAFNFEEAARSFRRAIELDPQAPMAYWGLAVALGPNYNNRSSVSGEHEKEAYEALEKAKSLAAAGAENERAYVDVLSHLFTNDPSPNLNQMLRDYIPAARELTHRFPNDPDIAALFAESLMELHPRALWTYEGKPSDATPEIVEVLEGALKRWPGHAGLNHFYIHTMEASPTPERALASARRLETLVPGSGHLVHMPSHIYLRTGDYTAAVKSNEDAVAIDREYLRTRAIKNYGYVMGYAEHNLSFLAYAAGMDGEFEKADHAAKDLESFARAALAESPEMQVENYLNAPLLVRLRFARWDEILSWPEPDAKLHGLAFFRHYARGCAFAVHGQTREAAAERTAMEAAYQQIPAGAALGMLPNNWRTIHEIALHALDARIAASSRNAKVAIEDWRAAIEAQNKMIYHEPPDWYYPMRESLGALLLRNGEAAEAEKVFREDLSKNPNNPRSLFGLWKALEAQKKTSEAESTRRMFDAGWKGDRSGLRLEDF